MTPIKRIFFQSIESIFLTNSFIFILQLFLEIDDQTTDIKKFECSICGKHVRHQKTLIYHIQRVHKDLNKHVHDSDAKSNDKYEIADKTIEEEPLETTGSIEKIVPLTIAINVRTKPNQCSEDQKSQVNEFYLQKIFYA